MTDNLSPERRSQNMARIRRGDTLPEMTVRRLLHRLGYRYVVHYRGLPGSPDVAFPRRRKVIFVHGCFWHQHACRRGTRPTSNRDFWNRKLDRNVVRDQQNRYQLEQDDWSILIIWECEVEDTDRLTQRLIEFLGATRLSTRST